VQVHLQWLHIVFETKGTHGPQQVVTIDGLPLLSLTFVGRLTCIRRSHDSLNHYRETKFKMFFQAGQNGEHAHTHTEHEDRRHTGDETDELRYTLLHSLFRVLGYLCIRRQRFLHDSAHVCYGQKPVLLSHRCIVVPVVAPGLVIRMRAAVWRSCVMTVAVGHPSQSGRVYHSQVCG
jgi:hypothetical protein